MSPTATKTRPSEVDTTVLTEHPIHPAADMFPMLDDTSLRDLAEDLKANGQLEPIWTYEGAILDGRNRLVACRLAGVTPVFQEWAPNQDSATPTTFVVSRNLHRRHLTPSQRAALAVQLEAALAQETVARRAAARSAKGTKGQPAFSNPETEQPIAVPTTPNTVVQFTSSQTGKATDGGRRNRDRAAKVFSVSPAYVTDAKAIQKDNPDIFKEMLAGEMSLPQARDTVVADAKAKGTLDTLHLRPGAVRDAMARIDAKNSPKKTEAKPRIKLPKASKVVSSKTTVQMTVTFGNPGIAEEWLNRLQDDKRCLDLDYEVLAATKRTPKKK